MLPNTVSGTINNSVQCTLRASHQYLIRPKLYTSSSATLADDGFFSWGMSDFDNGGADCEGVDYDSVNLTWQ